MNREYHRSKEEEQLWKTDRDPILVLAKWLIEQGYADVASLDATTKEVRAIMEAPVKFAIAAPYPSVDEVEKHVYAWARTHICAGSPRSAGRTIAPRLARMHYRGGSGRGWHALHSS